MLISIAYGFHHAYAIDINVIFTMFVDFKNR